MLPEAARKHEIRWDPNTSEWVCVRCDRTSVHVNKRDAETELSQFDCVVSSVTPDST